MYIMKNDIKKLFKDICCSRCKSGFDEDSIHLMRYEEDLTVVQLECKKCETCYGVAFLGFSGICFKEPLEIQEGPEAINYDDVIEAHKFIQNLEGNWQDYLPKDDKKEE